MLNIIKNGYKPDGSGYDVESFSSVKFEIGPVRLSVQKKFQLLIHHSTLKGSYAVAVT